MTEENQGYTSQNEEDAIRKENEDKQPSSTTITLRIPYSLKARLYDLSEQSKMTINAFAGTRLYKYVQGEIAETKELQEQVERLNSDLSEANSQMQKWEEMYKKLEKKAEEHGQRPTQNQLDKVKQEKDQLAKQVSDLQKQLKQAESDKGKTADEKDKRIKQLEKELDQYKADTKDKENERKSEAAKREQLEQKTVEMQYYINRHTISLFNAPHQFVEGVPKDPDGPGD
jgi:chromosome segregation ATPase